ncbi:unnamed protein product [Cylicocyclus nassatus]|uniref:Peptidase S1 domain-containing protein n=1 Tax=Cylicocyclus nassatus TaxID=53992 RepID=A0AA36H2U1_CYLNA|nr:unnamed protein product [Cylicocyclus nassatus]
MFFFGLLLVYCSQLVACLRFCDSLPNSSFLRIIGGSVAKREHPWQAALVSYDFSNSGLICGATVLDEHWILTAAHCIVGSPKKSFILTGLTSLSSPEHIHHVERFVVHPDYDAKGISDDIALVKSKYSLYDDGVSSVCLARNDFELLSSAQGIVTGFGLHIVSQSLFGVTMGVSDVVLEASLPIISRSKCQREWGMLSGGTINISEKQICAGSRMHGTGPGDSGGPLLAKAGDGKLVQVGITSFGAAGFQGLLDQNTYPGVYTRVSPYIPWIEKVITSASCRSTIFITYALIIVLLGMADL